MRPWQLELAKLRPEAAEAEAWEAGCAAGPANAEHEGRRRPAEVLRRDQGRQGLAARAGLRRAEAEEPADGHWS